MIARVIRGKISCGQYVSSAHFNQVLLDTAVEAKFNPPRLERKSLQNLFGIKQAPDELFQGICG